MSMLRKIEPQLSRRQPSLPGPRSTKSSNRELALSNPKAKVVPKSNFAVRTRTPVNQAFKSVSLVSVGKKSKGEGSKKKKNKKPSIGGLIKKAVTKPASVLVKVAKNPVKPIVKSPILKNPLKAPAKVLKPIKPLIKTALVNTPTGILGRTLTGDKTPIGKPSDFNNFFSDRAKGALLGTALIAGGAGVSKGLGGGSTTGVNNFTGQSGQNSNDMGNVFNKVKNIGKDLGLFKGGGGGGGGKRNDGLFSPSVGGQIQFGGQSRLSEQLPFWLVVGTVIVLLFSSFGGVFGGRRRRR